VGTGGYAGTDGMDARLEKSLRLLAVIAAAGTIAGLAVNFAQGRISASSMVVGIAYGLLMSVAIGGTELFVLQGPMRAWLGDLSFTANLMVRSAIYAAIIVVIQFFQSGEIAAGCRWKLPVKVSGPALSIPP
jgi:adenylate cyclase